MLAKGTFMGFGKAAIERAATKALWKSGAYMFIDHPVRNYPDEELGFVNQLRLALKEEGWDFQYVLASNWKLPLLFRDLSYVMRDEETGRQETYLLKFEWVGYPMFKVEAVLIRGEVINARL